MIAYITLGVDDIALAKRFYSTFLPHLGYELKESSEGLSCTLPEKPDQATLPVELYIKPPFNGAAATPGNGTMIAFDAQSQQKVRELHSAALAAGGTDEGQPGFREAYSAHFYVAYMRDPQGNKIALFSDNRNEPGRDD